MASKKSEWSLKKIHDNPTWIRPKHNCNKSAYGCYRYTLRSPKHLKCCNCLEPIPDIILFQLKILDCYDV